MSHPTSPRLSTAPQSRVRVRNNNVRETCKTCTSCRRKKVKCNGQRPQCQMCRSINQICEYPQDARKSAVRVRKADFDSLQDQLNALRQQVATRHMPLSNAAPSHGDSTSVDVTVDDHFTASPGPEPEPEPELEPEPAPHVPSSSKHKSTIPAQIPVYESAPATPHLLHVATEHSLNPGVGNNKDNLPSPWARIRGHGSQRPSVSASRSSTRISNDHPRLEATETTSQAYGLTSLLHDHSSASPSFNARVARTPQQRQADDHHYQALRDHLVSFSALRRQEEASLVSSPGILSTIDFDTVSADVAMHLLDLHWNRQQMSYLLTYRPAIMDSLVRNGPYVNKLLLNAIYLQSSLYSDRLPVRTRVVSDQSLPLGLDFYDRFKTLLPQYIDKPTIPTIIALLTCGSCLVPYGQQSAGWIFCGIAYRMITDIRCQFDQVPSSSPSACRNMAAVEAEMRKRLYWGAYVGDKFQSLFLGRAPAMHKANVNVSREYLDSYEEMESWSPYKDPQMSSFDASIAILPPYIPRPAYALSTFRCLLELCDIAADIIQGLYSTDGPHQDAEVLFARRKDIRLQLEQWHQCIPSWLNYEPEKHPTPPPHQITIHTTYWTLVILTEQAFLNGAHFGFTLDEDLQNESRQRCIQAALQIWKIVEAYRGAFSLRRAQYGVAYATYCAVLVILQQTDQDCDEYIDCIRFFWDALLEYQKGCNWGLLRPLRLLRSLMRRLKRVTESVNIDKSTVQPGLGSSSTEQVHLPDFNLDFPLQTTDQNVTQLWDESCIDDITADGLFANDTVFGIADDALMGSYM